MNEVTWSWLIPAVEIALEDLGNQPETIARWLVEDYRRMRAHVIGSVQSQARQDGHTSPPDPQIERALRSVLRGLVEYAARHKLPQT